MGGGRKETIAKTQCMCWSERKNPAVCLTLQQGRARLSLTALSFAYLRVRGVWDDILLRISDFIEEGMDLQRLAGPSFSRPSVLG